MTLDLVGAVGLPVLTDRSLGAVASAGPHPGTTVHPSFYCDVRDFARHLTTRPWVVSVMDVGHVEDQHDRPDGSRPFWRLDVVDQRHRLGAVPDRPILALVRDRYDLAAQAAVAELAAVTPTVAGAVTSLDHMDDALVRLASDGHHWNGIGRARIDALQQVLAVLEDDSRRRTGYWTRHLLVAAAAGYLGPQAVATLLSFGVQTVKSWSGRVDAELRRTFDLAPPGYPTTMIAATAQALQPWLWHWARRHRSDFEYGFLEQVVPDAFSSPLLCSSR